MSLPAVKTAEACCYRELADNSAEGVAFDSRAIVKKAPTESARAANM